MAVEALQGVTRNAVSGRWVLLTNLLHFVVCCGLSTRFNGLLRLVNEEKNRTNCADGAMTKSNLWPHTYNKTKPVRRTIHYTKQTLDDVRCFLKVCDQTIAAQAVRAFWDLGKFRSEFGGCGGGLSKIAASCWVLSTTRSSCISQQFTLA